MYSTALLNSKMLKNEKSIKKETKYINVDFWNSFFVCKPWLLQFIFPTYNFALNSNCNIDLDYNEASKKKHTNSPNRKYSNRKKSIFYYSKSMNEKNNEHLK